MQKWSDVGMRTRNVSLASGQGVATPQPCVRDSSPHLENTWLPTTPLSVPTGHFDGDHHRRRWCREAVRGERVEQPQDAHYERSLKIGNAGRPDTVGTIKQHLYNVVFDERH